MSTMFISLSMTLFGAAIGGMFFNEVPGGAIVGFGVGWIIGLVIGDD